MPLFLITVVVATLYLVRYVRKIEKDPLSSPTHAIDEQIRPFLAPEEASEEIKNLTAVIIYILICFAVLAAVVAGGPMVPLLQDLAFPLIMLIFLFMGIGSGLIAGTSAKRVMHFFFRGMGDFVGAVPIILMAFSVGYLIDIGRVMDTILFYQCPIVDRARAGQDHLQGLVQMDPARPAGTHGGMHCLSADCRQHQLCIEDQIVVLGLTVTE